ncbi:class F sortase [Micromonospora sp. NPDC050397]|uniref:class F sortase n=1 Tax=Micromonospora sp. NPDC050397 TaxID=3364279 RepID=UPI00384FCBFA
MARSSDGSGEGAGGRHVWTWRAAGYALVALLALVGSGLIGAALNAAPELPPQPAADAAPAYLDDAEADPVGPEASSNIDPALLPPAIPAPSPSVGSATSPSVGPVPSASGSGSASPAPSAPAAVSPNPAPPGTTGTATATTPSGGMARSEPTDVTISKIGVAAKLMSLGVDPTGMIEVPPLSQAELAGWYRLGPSPGEIGNSVIVGHVDSHEIGPAVFFKLGSLKPGDRIKVSRKDGSVVEFTVDGVKSYPKVAFPTELVYGPSEKAGLRLVTCGGQFDRKKRSYPDNIIVFATATTPTGAAAQR